VRLTNDALNTVL